MASALPVGDLSVQMGTLQASARPMTKGKYRGFDPDYLSKTRFNGGRAAIK
jgi:hypothetical protein